RHRPRAARPRPEERQDRERDERPVERDRQGAREDDEKVARTAPDYIARMPEREREGVNPSRRRSWRDLGALVHARREPGRRGVVRGVLGRERAPEVVLALFPERPAPERAMEDEQPRQGDS